MFVLVKYNSLTYENLYNLLSSKKYTPLPLLSISLTKKKEENKENIQKLKNLINSNNLINPVLQITLNSIDNTTQGIINQLKQYFDIIIGVGGLNKVNRFFLEQTQIDFLQDPHSSRFKVKFDFIHHFNSGLNHVLCKFAQEKNIGIIYSFNFMKNKGISILKDIGRVSQNTYFANKYNLPIYANFIIEKEEDIISELKLVSLQKQFNLTTKQISLSKNILEKRLNLNKKKKLKQYITKGLEEIK